MDLSIFIARAMQRLGEFGEAREALLELASSIAPTDSYARHRVYRYRGLTELDAGEPQLALAEFERAAAEVDEYVEWEYDTGAGALGARR